MGITNLNKLKEEIVKQLAFQGGASAEWVKPFDELKKRAIQIFTHEGFPPLRHEEWKYSPLSSFLSDQLSIPSKSHESGSLGIIQQYVSRFPDAMHIILENGTFFLTGCIHDSGVSVNSLSNAATIYAEVIQLHFGKYAALSQQPFVALNTAIVDDGAFIYVKKNEVAKVPVFVHHVVNVTNSGTLVNNRLLVVAEQNSRVEVVEVFHSLNHAPQLSNTVTEGFVGSNAELYHYVLHTESAAECHIGNVFIHQEKDSRLHTFNISLAGKFIRNNLNIEIHGTGAENHMWGLYLLSGDTHVDNHTLVDHKVPYANSNEHYKGILTGHATGVFNGKIYVRENAQKTNAFQSNNNLLLSKECTINTKPQLEIFADDVKCSHGATIGQLQDEPLFYLRTRGLNEVQAKKLLVRAFAEEIISKIDYAPLHDWMEERINTWFEANIE